MEKLLMDMYRAAVDAARPDRVLPGYLESIVGPVTVIGAGKAAAEMAAVVERNLEEVRGAVVTVSGGDSQPSCQRINVLYASHPIPDQSSVNAAKVMLDIAVEASRTESGTMLCLLSGGGSSLMSLPPPGVSIQEKAGLVKAMLAAGAPIQSVNCVRRHLSAVKGGRLALAAAPCPVLTLAISDVVGDGPCDIASGPTVPDPTSLSDAMTAINDCGVRPSQSILAALRDPANETPFLGDPAMKSSEFKLIATASDALAAAVRGVSGMEIINLGESAGDSGQVAAQHAGVVKDLVTAGRKCVLVSGGETTTVIRGPGRGGSNTEYLLSLAVELAGMTGVWAIAADTDGVDGKGGHAGAWFGPEFLQLMKSSVPAARQALARSDSAGFLDAFGNLIVAGPTGTNVNDFRAIIIGPDAPSLL